MKPKAPYPYRAGYRFQSLEDLRRMVSDIEVAVREFGYHPEEVLFSGEFMLSLVSEKLTDGSITLNLTVAIAPRGVK